LEIAGMTQQIYQPNSNRMWALLLPATIYLGWMMYLPMLTGATLFDGSVGVVLGLYICSHPAANGIDLLFLQRGALRRAARQWSGVEWLALNALVMLIGWIVIVVGAARFMVTHTQTSP
jgi:hypothetical protein